MKSFALSFHLAAYGCLYFHNQLIELLDVCSIVLAGSGVIPESVRSNGAAVIKPPASTKHKDTSQSGGKHADKWPEQHGRKKLPELPTLSSENEGGAR